MLVSLSYVGYWWVGFNQQYLQRGRKGTMRFRNDQLELLVKKVQMFTDVSSVFVSVEQLDPKHKALLIKLCDVENVYDR